MFTNGNNSYQFCCYCNSAINLIILHFYPSNNSFKSMLKKTVIVLQDSLSNMLYQLFMKSLALFNIILITLIIRLINNIYRA